MLTFEPADHNILILDAGNLTVIIKMYTSECEQRLCEQGLLKCVGELTEVCREETPWPELNMKTQNHALRVSDCLLHGIFLVGKNQFDLSDIKEKLTPLLLLSLRPIYFLVQLAAHEFRGNVQLKAVPISVRISIA